MGEGLEVEADGDMADMTVEKRADIEQGLGVSAVSRVPRCRATAGGSTSELPVPRRGAWATEPKAVCGWLAREPQMLPRHAVDLAWNRLESLARSAWHRHHSAGFAMMRPSAATNGSGSWYAKHCFRLVRRWKSARRRSSSWVRPYGKRNPIRFSGNARRAALMAGTMSVSPVTNTAMSHVSVANAAIIEAAIATSVSFSSCRTTGAPQIEPLRALSAHAMVTLA